MGLTGGLTRGLTAGLTGGLTRGPGGGTGGAGAPPAPPGTPAFGGSVARARAQGRLWQDTAKTVPATADGDPVRVWVDDAGSALTAPSDAARPVLRDEGGGGWAVELDGAARCLLLPAPVALAGDWTVAASGTRYPAGSGNFIPAGGSTANQAVVCQPLNASFALIIVSDDASSAPAGGTGTVPDDTPDAVRWACEAGAASFTDASGSHAVGAVGTVTVDRLFARQPVGQFSVGRVAGLAVYAGTLAAAGTDAAAVDAWAASLI